MKTTAEVARAAKVSTRAVLFRARSMGISPILKAGSHWWGISAARRLTANRKPGPRRQRKGARA